MIKIGLMNLIPVVLLFLPTLEYKDKIILIYEDNKNVYEELDIKELLEEELIPKSFLYRKNNPREGIALSRFILKRVLNIKYLLRKIMFQVKIY